MTADEYESFAADYHWFFDDTALRLGSDVPGVRAAISRLEPGARVLDAACGIGLDASWLHRHGFEVAAADASAAMVALTAARLSALDGGDQIAVVECDWTELPARFEPASFDALLCTGSAIAHLPDERAMVAAFESFRSMLVPGGWVVLDSHDWEVVFAEGGRASVDPVVVVRDGVRCARSFSWHLPVDFGDAAVFEPAVTLHEEGRVTKRSYPTRLWPFTRAQLRERLRAAGFEAVGLDAMPGDDRYTAVGRAAA